MLTFSARAPCWKYRLRRRLGLRRAAVYRLRKGEGEQAFLVFGEGREGRSFRTFEQESVEGFLAALVSARGSLTLELPPRDPYRDGPREFLVPAWVVRKVREQAKRLLGGAPPTIDEPAFWARTRSTGPR